METILAKTAELRKLINDTLLLSSDLDAFCIDYYPNTFTYFTNGMNRVDKVNLLLQMNTPDSLIERLHSLRSARLVSVSASIPPLPHDEHPSTRRPVHLHAELSSNGSGHLRPGRAKAGRKTLVKAAGVLVALGLIATGAVYLLRAKERATASAAQAVSLPGTIAKESFPHVAASAKISKPRRLSTALLPTSSNLISISGTNSRDIWAVGVKNTVVHFDGERWMSINPALEESGWDGDWKGVWSQAIDDVWIVGSSGRIMHFDGSRWASYETHTEQPLWRVWARSADDVWAVGNSGTIIRFNGKNWYPIQSGTTNNLLTLWGNAERVWIVGREGMILQCTSQCTSEATQKNVWIRGIFGFVGEGKTSLWAVGNDGLILRREAGTWNKVVSITHNHLLRIWGSAVDDIWAVGANGTVIHWDGQDWESISTGTDETLSGVWGSDKNNVWLIGANGRVMRYYAN